VKELFFHIILFLFLPFSVFAGGDVFPVGAPTAGLCRSSVAVKGFWGIMNNQAGMALLESPEIAMAYENRFLLKETGNHSAAFAFPTRFGVIGSSFNYFGYNQYNEMKVGLAYARAFGKYIRIGLQLDYLRTSISEGYGTKNNFTFELGVQSDVTREITLGAYVFNPVRVKMADYADERIPAIFRFGMTWHFSDDFFATAEFEKNSFYSRIIIRGGLQYTLREMFVFRTGVSSGLEVFSMGFGFHLRGLKFDLAATMHQMLGFSPQVSLAYAF
jgi:hypothetical protein